jgi:phage tail-like protein
MSNNYPLTTNHFVVQMGFDRLSFTEISGLAIEHEVLETRSGEMKDNKFQLLPGVRKSGRLILKRGMIPGDNQFYEWINTHTFSKVERRDIVIMLLNENHEPVVVWKVKNAWPVRLEGPVLNANRCEVAIETLEIAYESLEIENAG